MLTRTSIWLLTTVGVLAVGTTTVKGFQRQQQEGVCRSSNAIRTAHAHGNYLDSLSIESPAQQHRNPGPSTSTSTSTSTSILPKETTPEQTTIAETPEEHYAKEHFGAGWAGYKHPLYGGYLDHLGTTATAKGEEDDDNDDDDELAGTTRAMEDTPSETNTNTNTAILEAGKKADYGDDIRWGAQVYLDNL